MLRRAFLPILLAVSVLPVAIVTAESAAAAGTLQLGTKPAAPAFQPPWAPNVRETDAPDPDVLRVGSTYYAYTTGTTWGNHHRHPHVDPADDRLAHDHEPAVRLLRVPAIPPGTSLRPWQVNGSQHAPGVFFFGGRYVMFYTAQTDVGSRRALLPLGRDASTSPKGPFSDASTGPCCAATPTAA